MRGLSRFCMAIRAVVAIGGLYRGGMSVRARMPLAICSALLLRRRLNDRDVQSSDTYDRREFTNISASVSPLNIRLSVNPSSANTRMSVE